MGLVPKPGLGTSPTYSGYFLFNVDVLAAFANPLIVSAFDDIGSNSLGDFIPLLSRLIQGLFRVGSGVSGSYGPIQGFFIFASTGNAQVVQADFSAFFQTFVNDILELSSWEGFSYSNLLFPLVFMALRSE